jgi:hypothetical protein
MERGLGRGALAIVGARLNVVNLHLIGFVQVLLPRAFGRRELAAAVAAEAAVAGFGAVEFGQEPASLAIDEPRRALALEDGGRLEKHQAAVALQDDLEVALEDVRPLLADRGQRLSLASLLRGLGLLLGSLRRRKEGSGRSRCQQDLTHLTSPLGQRLLPWCLDLADFQVIIQRARSGTAVSTISRLVDESSVHGAAAQESLSLGPVVVEGDAVARGAGRRQIARS